MLVNDGLPGLILATLLWSGNYIAGRVLVPVLPPLVLNAARWTISALVLLVILGLQGRRVRLIAKWKQLLVMGLTGMFIFSSFTYLGLQTVPAAQAGIISASMPAAIVVFSMLVLGERPGKRAWLGIVLSILGVVVLAGSDLRAGIQLTWGHALLLTSAAAWGLYTALGKRYGDELDSIEMTAGAAVYGAIPSIAAAGLTWSGPLPHFTLVTWAALLYVSTMASVLGYFAWTWGVSKMGASRSAPFMNLMPVWTVILSIVILGESVSPWQLVGGVIVIAGAVLTSWRPGANHKATARKRQAGS